MSEFPKNPSGKPESSMSSAINWRGSIEVLAGDRQCSDTKDSMIARAARRAGVSFRNARALYYGETDDPRFSVGRRINEAAKHQADRFTAIADSLEAKDHEFFREEIDRLRSLARRVGRETG